MCEVLSFRNQWNLISKILSKRAHKLDNTIKFPPQIVLFYIYRNYLLKMLWKIKTGIKVIKKKVYRVKFQIS